MPDVVVYLCFVVYVSSQKEAHMWLHMTHCAGIDIRMNEIVANLYDNAKDVSIPWLSNSIK